MLKPISRLPISLVISVILFSSLLYAGYTVEFDSATGVMDITTTDGEDITITKHPTTGGLAINGT